MAADKYTSILAMRLQMEQQQQQQQRAEALQREQMNDQMEMKALDTMVRTGQSYFAAMKAADDRDLKLAEAKYKQDLAYQEAERKDKIARAEAAAKITAAEVKMGHQTEERIATDITKMDRTRVMAQPRIVLTKSEERKVMIDEIKAKKNQIEKAWEPVAMRYKALMKGKKGGAKLVGVSKTQAKAEREEIRRLAGMVGGFEARLDDAKARRGGIESNAAHVASVMQEFRQWLETADGKRFIHYAGSSPIPTTPTAPATPGPWAIPETAAKRATSTPGTAGQVGEFDAEIIKEMGF